MVRDEFSGGLPGGTEVITDPETAITLSAVTSSPGAYATADPRPIPKNLVAPIPIIRRRRERL